ncbi:MAG: hypothetical protein JWP01_1221 [Myxococcales bacterium]|nr:hypothetical protein [Myxococcales bacterium]
MMRAIVVASLLSGLIGCSADMSSSEPPVLEVTSPTRGTTMEGDQVTVTGTVQDDHKGVRVTVNGTTVTPSADGSFTATVPARAGIEIIETHAIDSDGNDVRDVRAVLAGHLEATDGTIASPVGARVSAAALTTVGNLIGSTVEKVDFTAAAQAMNPVYNNTGCLGAKIDITTISIANIDVGMVPTTGAITTAVAIDDVTVKMHANFKVACIGGSTNITVRTTKARINGALGLAVTGGKLTSSLPNATVALDGFTVDIGGVPGAIESLLKGEARKAAEKALTNLVKDKVPTFANTALEGLVAKPYTAGILGHDTRVMVTPKELVLSSEGLYVAVDTKLAVAGGEGGMFVSNPAPMSASLMTSTSGLGVAIANDAVNQLFSGLWAAGAMEQTLPIESVGVVASLLDDDAKTVGIELMLPPTVSSAGSALTLSVGDMIVTVKDASGVEIQKLALSLSTTLAASPTQTGAVTLAVGTPTLYAQVLAQTDAVDRPLTSEQVEGIITGVWGVVGGQADSALANLPMPTISGVTLGAPSVEGRDGFVFAEIPLSM